MDYFEENNVTAIITSISGNTAFLKDKVNDLYNKGIYTATITNDIKDSKRVLSVDCDGIMMGKLACEMLFLLSPTQKNILLTGSLVTPKHASNIEGFKDFANKHNMVISEIYEHDDNPKLIAQKTDEIFDRYMSGFNLYITSASSNIACQQIYKRGKKDNVNIVTTDLFSNTKRCLSDGIISATLYQNPYLQGATVVRKLYYYLTGIECSGKFLISPQIILRANSDCRGDIVHYPEFINKQ